MAIDVFEAIHTARAFRRFKPDPVPEAVITQILDAAIRAPSAGNAQNWAFVVVRDPAQRRRLGEVYRKGSDIASAMYAARGRPPHVTEEQFQKMMTSGALAVGSHGRCAGDPRAVPDSAGAAAVETLPADVRSLYEQERRYVERIRGASIYPAMENIILACRALGLGTTITTNHIRCEDEVKEVLGIPDNVQTLRHDADRLPLRKVRPGGAPAGRRGHLCRPLGAGVAGHRPSAECVKRAGSAQLPGLKYFRSGGACPFRVGIR